MKRWRQTVFLMALLLGAAAETAIAGSPPVFLENDRIDHDASGAQQGRMLAAEGRRLLNGPFGGPFYYLNDDGVWFEELVVPSFFEASALDDDQAAWLVAGLGGTVVPWSDDTGIPDLSAQIQTPEGGNSIAIAGDTLVLGDTTVGRVRAYLRTGDMWSLEFEQLGAPAFNNLGSAVDLDGARLVFSDPSVSNGLTGEVFSRLRNSNGTWVDFGSITAPEAEAGNGFGTSLSVSGPWLAVGAPFEDTAFPQPIGTDVGAVYLYKTNVFGFYQHQASIFGTEDGQNFGMDVELDEGTLVVGAPGEDQIHFPPFGVNRGAAYVYWRDGDVWSLQSKLAGSDGSAGDLLGTTVEIAGPYVFAGAPMNDGPSGADTGTVYIYSGQVHAYIFTDGFESGNTSAWSTVSP